MTRHWKLIQGGALAALLLLAAYTHDEPSSPKAEGALPYGEYPLQISGVTLGVESGAEPWKAEGPQTRLAEKADGTGSAWQWDGTERIAVRLGEATALYTLNADRTLTSDQPLYWTSTDPAAVAAWYPADETVGLGDQTAGLAYVLQATVPEARYDQPVALAFAHRLAKVRVVVDGTQLGKVTRVEVYGHTSCTHTQGGNVAGSGTQGWIAMHRVDDATYEAGVVPGPITPSNFIRLNGHAVVSGLAGIPATLDAAGMYTIDLTAGDPLTEITADNCDNINDNGNYRVSGSFGQTITVTGGSPTIYLENANISVGSGNAINVTSGAPTIRIIGNNSVTTRNIVTNLAAGIYVAHGSTITISGNNMEEDVLRITGGCDGAAIGGYCTGYGQHTNCGDITVSNVTVYAEVSNNYQSAYAPGIGSTGSTCGTITITNAIVHARGFGDMYDSAPAIGAYESVPEIVITDSEIHAYRGSYNGTSYADYIGRGGSMIDYQGGQIQYGSGSITGSTIYKYTYNASTGSSSSDGSVTY